MLVYLVSSSVSAFNSNFYYYGISFPESIVLILVTNRHQLHCLGLHRRSHGPGDELHSLDYASQYLRRDIRAARLQDSGSDLSAAGCEWG